MKTLIFIVLGIAVICVVAMTAWVLYMRGLEQPKYTVVEKDGDIEIRDYVAMTVAEVRRTGDRDKAVRSGFRPLANYIFAEERAGEKIAMTAPVTQQIESEQTVTKADDSTEWNVRFILPSDYDLKSLPEPVNDDVRLKEIPASRKAVIRFSGRANDKLIARQQGHLIEWMQSRGIEAIGSPIYAYYEDPFTPGFLRRNEVLIDITQSSGS